MDIKNNVVLITGASGGIGAELAKLFASDGKNLLLVARNQEKLKILKNELEAEYKVTVTVFEKDLCETGAAKQIYDFVNQNNMQVDVLVNNAGFGDWGLFAERSLEKYIQMISLNISVLTELTHYFLSGMIERKAGRILNVASVASFFPGAKMAVYYASKAYVRSFSEALAVETKSTGVTVTALCPGPVSTDFWERTESKMSLKLSFATSTAIARAGYRGLKKGKVIVIPGVSIKILVFLSRFSPRSWVRNIIYSVQK